MYGLTQVPRAWYDILYAFVVGHEYVQPGVDTSTTLLVKKFRKYFMIAQIYVDVIVFGSNFSRKVDTFGEHIKGNFQMSMIG